MKSFLSLFALLMVCWVAPLQAETKSTPPRILAIGDSLVAWHKGRGRSIADVVAKSLDEPVRNRAVGGARMIYNLPVTGALGLSIPRQVAKGPWDWVILSGGGNDLWFGCGCSRCDRRIEKMVSADGRKGMVPGLVKRIRNSGAKVVMIGYLRSPGVGSVIESCKDDGDAYEARLSEMADAMQGVYFLSNADLVPHGDRSFHGGDMIHPSPKGSAAVGARVAELIKRVDRKR